METFHRLFGSLLSFVYHCFDRVVIQGYLPLRMIRLLEVLLHGGPQLNGWRTTHVWEAVRSAFSLSALAYALNQLRYDLRKLKGHGLLERMGEHYAYRLTEKGIRVAALFTLFHKRICGPLANSCSTTSRHPAPGPLPKSRSPTKEPTPLFKTSLISWLPEKNLKKQILRFARLDSCPRIGRLGLSKRIGSEP
jgi:hypothetical protein